jgi:hypothetical protein
MADYLGFGATGCQLGALTFSDFSFSPGLAGAALPASQVSVQPSVLGDSQRFTFSGTLLPPFTVAPFFGTEFGFKVDGAGIVRDSLLLIDIGIGGGTDDVRGNAVPPGTPGNPVVQNNLSVVRNPIDICTAFPGACRDFDSITFDPINSQNINLEAGGETGVTSFAVDVATTPEPGTILLLGTSLAALGVIRRRQHPRH